jgi:hypothetical protein
METIDTTPEWHGMFRFAIQLVKFELPKDKGQALVVEMLEYGARLDNAMSKKKGGE